MMCRVLEVSRSGYHAWVRRPPSTRALEDARVTARIRVLYQQRRGVSGSPRIWADLVMGDGGRIAARRLMRNGLSGRYQEARPRPCGLVADGSHRCDFASDSPNRCWVADITYLRTWEGWLYLVAVQDLYSRRTSAGRAAMRTTPTRCRSPSRTAGHPGLIWPSARKARAAGIAQSMGSKGDCFDNAVAESFFATLKKELIHRRSWPTKIELRTEVFDYIEVFYNRERRHSTLGQLSPAQYEKSISTRHMPA